MRGTVPKAAAARGTREPPPGSVAASPQVSQDAARWSVSRSSATARAAAMIGRLALVSGTVAAASSGNKQTILNLQMGYAPFFKADLTVVYANKIVTFSFARCVASKFNFNLKNEDFAVPEFDFHPMDDGTGNVMKWSTSE